MIFECGWNGSKTNFLKPARNRNLIDSLTCKTVYFLDDKQKFISTAKMAQWAKMTIDYFITKHVPWNWAFGLATKIMVTAKAEKTYVWGLSTQAKLGKRRINHHEQSCRWWWSHHPPCSLPSLQLASWKFETFDTNVYQSNCQRLLSKFSYQTISHVYIYM